MTLEELKKEFAAWPGMCVHVSTVIQMVENAEAKAAALEKEREQWHAYKNADCLLAAKKLIAAEDRSDAAEARAEALAGLLRRAVVLHQYEPLSGSGNVTPCRACGRFFYQHMRDNEDRGWCHSPADAALESPRPPPEDAFWVAERRCGAAMTPGYYAADPNCGPVVFSIHHAKRFASREEATAWIEKNVRGMYEAREHIIFKPADPALGECVGHLGPPSNTGTPHPRGETCSHWKQLPEKGEEVPDGAAPAGVGGGALDRSAHAATGAMAVASIGAAPALSERLKHDAAILAKLTEPAPPEPDTGPDPDHGMDAAPAQLPEAPPLGICDTWLMPHPRGLKGSLPCINWRQLQEASSEAPGVKGCTGTLVHSEFVPCPVHDH